MFYSPYLLKKYYSNYVWEIPTNEKVIYLTFDDGPIPEITEFVLKTLANFDAQATFFCIGDNIRKHPEVYRQIVEANHRIGNHTYHHLNGWKTKNNIYFENIDLCQNVLTSESKLFRPPYGRIKNSQGKKLILDGKKIIMWSVLSKDYSPKITPENCLKYCIKYTKPGSIVLFHDSKKAFKNMSFALPKFLKHFQELGYIFKGIEFPN